MTAITPLNAFLSARMTAITPLGQKIEQKRGFDRNNITQKVSGVIVTPCNINL